MSIEDKIDEDKVKIYKTIGEFPGFKTKAGWEMFDREGVICNVQNSLYIEWAYWWI